MLNLKYFFTLTILISLVSGLYEQCFYKKNEGVCLRQDDCKLIDGQKGTVIPYSSPNICINKTINKVVCCIKTLSVISDGKTKITGRCLNTESCMSKFKKLSFDPYYECTSSGKNAVLCPIKSFTTKPIFPPPLTKTTTTTTTTSVPTPSISYFDIITVHIDHFIYSIYQLDNTLRTEHPDVRGVMIRAGYTSYSNDFFILADRYLQSHYEMFKSYRYKIGFFYETQAVSDAEVDAEVDGLFDIFVSKGIDIYEDVPELPLYLYFRVSNYHRNADLSMDTRTRLGIRFINRVKSRAPQLKVGISAHAADLNRYIDYDMIIRNNISFWLVGYRNSITTTYDMFEYEQFQEIYGMTATTGYSHVYKDW
eukprot:jgi/Orpsp1_1/1180364/evm.model.c7180000073107.1